MLTFSYNAAQNIPTADSPFMGGDGIYSSYKFNDGDIPGWVDYDTIDSWDDCAFTDSGIGATEKGYITMFRGTMKWAEALGFTLPAGMVTDVDAEWVTLGGSSSIFGDDPVYAMTDSFS